MSSSNSSMDSSLVVVASTIFFFVVIAFGFFLHIYARSRRSSQPSVTPLTSLALTPEQAVTSAHGLDSVVLRSLPIHIFNSEDFMECMVCLSELIDGDKVRLLPGCGHGFHLDCIDMWFRSHSTCPLCRTKLAVVLQPSDALSSSSGPSTGDFMAIDVPPSREEHVAPTRSCDMGDLKPVEQGAGGRH